MRWKGHSAVIRMKHHIHKERVYSFPGSRGHEFRPFRLDSITSLLQTGNKNDISISFSISGNKCARLAGFHQRGVPDNIDSILKPPCTLGVSLPFCGFFKTWSLSFRVDCAMLQICGMVYTKIQIYLHA